MLTLKSNFNNYKDRQGSTCTVDDLTVLNKAIIASDIVNFKGDISYGYTDLVAQAVIKQISNKIDKKTSTILVINDLSLHMLNKLLENGYQLENIYLAYGKWNKNTISPLDDLTTYNIMVSFIKHNFNEPINIITLKEIFTMKVNGKPGFNLIIANPPYSALGANITKKIIDDVTFDDYVNLLPSKDYLNDKKGILYKYQRNLINLPAGMFVDTGVKTSIANISATPDEQLTKINYLLKSFVDDTVLSYFKQNSARKDIFSAIDKSGKSPLTWDIDRTIIAGWADTQSGHIISKVTSPTYRWNYLKDITQTELIENYNRPRAKKAGGYELCFYAFTFDTAIKKTNFTKFMYSQEGKAFINKLYKAMNTNGRKCYEYLWAFPKVDWNHEWTVEQILNNFNYSQPEITAILNELKNDTGDSD